jgi:hypothetical protein
MYRVHRDTELIATGETPQKAYATAEREAGYGRMPLRRGYSRYVDEGYSPRPYELLFRVSGDDQAMWVVLKDLEQEFVYVLSGIVGMVDAGLLPIEDAQQKLDAAKHDAVHWSSLPRERVRQLVRENFTSATASIELVADRLTLVPITTPSS